MSGDDKEGEVGDDGYRWSPIPDGGGLWGNDFSLQDNSAVDCTIIDADGDGDDDSSSVVISFDDQVYTGSFAVRVYLDRTDCKDASSNPNNWDYADQFKFSYEASSSEATYNNVDLTLTGVNRYVKSGAAKSALDGDTACGNSNWTVSAENAVDACTNADDALYTGFSLNESGVAQYSNGLKLEGVYHVVADDLGFQFGAVGSRPDGNAVVNNRNYKR